MFARYAAAERLVELDLLLAELRLFLAVIRAEEHHLVTIVLETGLLQDLAERNAGPPAVAREALDPSAAVARALEPGDHIVFAHLFELVERERPGFLDQTRDLQAERGGINRRMAVMLCGEELVLRRERPADRADVEDADHLARVGREVGRDVGERHERLALREHRHRPFGNAEKTQPCRRKAALEHRSTGGHVVHVTLLVWPRPRLTLTLSPAIWAGIPRAPRPRWGQEPPLLESRLARGARPSA